MAERGIQKLRRALGELVAAHGLSALKTGTEVEDMSFEDIHMLRRISADIVPLYVKIGGPEARNDMRELARIGVDCLIAPMIESVYALRKFVQTLREVLGAGYARVERGINLETIDGFGHMNGILACPEARELHQITAARTDLSGSMDARPDDPRVLEICAVIVARAREHELRTSVGGAILPESAERIMADINPDTINTRHMVFDCKAIGVKAAEAIQAGLRFEMELCTYLSTLTSVRQTAYVRRAEVLNRRLEGGRRQVAARPANR